MTDRDERIVEEFLSGTEVPQLAVRYAVPEAYVDQVIEQATVAKPQRWNWSLENWGNRLAYSLIAGTVVSLLTHIYALGTVVTVVLFVLTSAIVTAGRRR